MARKATPRDEVCDRTWMVKARLLRGLRQEDVANAVGITTGHYNKIENGISTPNVKIGVMIADALGEDPHRYLAEHKIA